MNDLYEVKAQLWIQKNNKNFIGPGRIELLKNIESYGSISKAAKHMKMSYKAAWDSVDIMNKLSHKKIVIKVIGGKGGGGTVITEYAKELIKKFNSIKTLNEEYLKLLELNFNEDIKKKENE